MKLSRTSSFYRSVYSQIEEIGWEHVLYLGEDLISISFRLLDKQGRAHLLEIQLGEDYPRRPPSISGDVPYIFDVKWSINSRLKDLVKQFRIHLDKLQEFWSIMEDIDNSFMVVDPKQPSRAASYRVIDIGNGRVMLSIDAADPQSLPEFRFMGPDAVVETLSKIWRKNCTRWMKEKTPSENLVNVLEMELPGPQLVHNCSQQVECGICYAAYLPIDEELGSKSGSKTDYTCDNVCCRKAFHTVCLGDWLRSITTRQSFNVVFGNCPYCSEAVAVKMESSGSRE